MGYRGRFNVSCFPALPCCFRGLELAWRLLPTLDLALVPFSLHRSGGVTQDLERTWQHASVQAPLPLSLSLGGPHRLICHEAIRVRIWQLLSLSWSSFSGLHHDAAPTQVG